MAGGADKTAALRDMMRVTIPGEPKPEIPEQERLFRQEKKRITERVAEALSGSSAPPKKPPKRRK
jgi:hypothetical protein